MRMDLGTRNTLLYDFMHCMTAVSLEMSDEPKTCPFALQKMPFYNAKGHLLYGKRASFRNGFVMY